MTRVAALTWPLEPLEVASGVVLEPDALPAVRVDRRGPGPRAVLEQTLLAALRSGSVSVSFSGGRDSSLVLALACEVARREGLPDPVPVTMRHRSPESDESEWQELVLRHLGIREWVRFDADDLDLMGDEATTFLGASGLLSPPNAYLHLGMLRAAPVDTLVSGAGGDEVLGTPGRRIARVLGRQTGPEARDVLRLAIAGSPRALRRRVEMRQGLPGREWLAPGVADRVLRRYADGNVAARLRWGTEAATWASSRTVQLMRRSLDRVGSATGTQVLSPLMSEAFVHAFARAVGPAGPPSRSWSMERLGADLLPAAVLTRSTKAVFNGVIWGPRFRAFARCWDPATLDRQVAALVDVELLRTLWIDGAPPFGTMSLAQRAWLDQAGA